jgi:hypothetical protein
MHRNIMTLVIILLIGLLFIPNPNRSSDFNVENNLRFRVIAKSGLKIRMKPNLNSNVLIKVPFNETLEIINKDEKSDNINGENGTWHKVKYNNLIGYAWSKFMATN